jgi:hypothetical protein
MACSCAGSARPCEAYGDASAVFVGIVTFNKSNNVKRAGYDTTQRVVRFHVDRPIRNVKDSDIEIQTAWGEAACGYGGREKSSAPLELVITSNQEPIKIVVKKEKI